MQEIYMASLNLLFSSITISMQGGNDDCQCGGDCTSGSFNPLVAVYFKVLAFLVFGHLLLVIFYTCARCFLSRRPRQHGHQAQRPERGLDPTAMAFLPTFVFKEWGDCNQEDPTKCAVCLSMLEQEDMARLLPNCNHIFHAQCIEDWLIRSQSTCPICRAQVTPHHLNSANAELRLLFLPLDLLLAPSRTLLKILLFRVSRSSYAVRLTFSPLYSGCCCAVGDYSDFSNDYDTSVITITSKIFH
ncbi:hypothetical protein Ancab_023694 [Ancistrocladus abbreviatus]